MVDTPKESNGDEATEDNPLEKQSKHWRHRRRSKPNHSKNSDTGTRDNNPDGAEDEYNPGQPNFNQDEQDSLSPKRAVDGELEEDNYMPLSEDKVSLGDEEFIVPEDPVEQERFKRRLIATAKKPEEKAATSSS